MERPSYLNLQMLQQSISLGTTKRGLQYSQQRHQKVSKCRLEWLGRVPLKHHQDALPSLCRYSMYRNPSEIFQKVSTWLTSATGKKKPNNKTTKQKPTNSSLFHLSVPKQTKQEQMLTCQLFSRCRNCHLWPPLHFCPLDKGFHSSVPESVSTHQTTVTYLSLNTQHYVPEYL